MIARIMGALVLILVALSAPSAKAAVCTASAQPLEFGPVDTLGQSGGQATTDMTIECTDVTSENVAVCINIGEGSGGASGSMRLMRAEVGTSELTYGLYTDEGGTAWGSLTNTSLGQPRRMILAASDGSAAGTATIHGLVAPSQPNARTGQYSSNFSAADVEIFYLEGASIDCSAPAGTLVSTSFQVRAAVSPNCLIDVDDLDFGSVGVINEDVTADTSLQVTCTPGASYSITMDNGLHYSGETRRMMSESGHYISYDLYQDPSGTRPWGSLRNVDTLDGTANGDDDQVIYGRVPPQLGLPGLYQDSVVVTIEYQ